MTSFFSQPNVLNAPISTKFRSTIKIRKYTLYRLRIGGRSVLSTIALFLNKNIQLLERWASQAENRCGHFYGCRMSTVNPAKRLIPPNRSRCRVVCRPRYGPKNHVLDGAAHWRHLANTIERLKTAAMWAVAINTVATCWQLFTVAGSGSNEVGA